MEGHFGKNKFRLYNYCLLLFLIITRGKR
jgi:hypothetical protein